MKRTKRKKFLALLCTFLLGISVFSGCAENPFGASTDPADYESMVFNNTPWGSSLEEVEKLYGTLTPYESDLEDAAFKTYYTDAEVSVFGFKPDKVEFTFFFAGGASYLMTTHTSFASLSREEYDKLGEMIRSVTDETLLEQTTGALSAEENERLNENVEKHGLNEMMRNDTPPKMKLYNIGVGYYSSGSAEKDDSLNCYLDFGATIKLLSERAY